MYIIQQVNNYTLFALFDQFVHNNISLRSKRFIVKNENKVEVLPDFAAKLNISSNNVNNIS
jgi:hypothetical protein